MAMADVAVEQREPMTIAYIEHTGSYDAIPVDVYLERLYTWAKDHGVRAGSPPIGVFYSVPVCSPAWRCRAEIGIPIEGPAEPAGEIRIREMAATDIATVPYEDVARCSTRLLFRSPATCATCRAQFRRLDAWLGENGFEWSGGAVEVFTKAPRVAGWKHLEGTRVQVPVKRVPRARAPGKHRTAATA